MWWEQHPLSTSLSIPKTQALIKEENNRGEENVEEKANRERQRREREKGRERTEEEITKEPQNVLNFYENISNTAVNS